MSWEKFKKIVSSFYFIASIVFLVWLSFFDGNDFYSQYMLHHKTKQLEAEKAFYLENIQLLEQQRQEFQRDEEVLEKIAREKYQMSLPKEEVYVVE